MLRRGTVLAVGAIALIVLVGLAFAGSPARIAEGVTIAGVDVGGLTPGEAVRTLEARAAAASRTPVAFTAAGLAPARARGSSASTSTGSAAVALARRENDGFAPVRGFRRIHMRMFGEEISPRVTVYDGALEYLVARSRKDVDRAHRRRGAQRRGLRIEVVPARTGRSCSASVRRGPSSQRSPRCERLGPVPLAVTVERPAVTAPMLARAARRARLALSAPVRLTFGATAWRLPRWRIAELLSLPSGGERNAGDRRARGPTACSPRSRDASNARPSDASFASRGGSVRVVPSRPGLGVDVPCNGARALAAAASPRRTDGASSPSRRRSRS